MSGLLLLAPLGLLALASLLVPLLLHLRRRTQFTTVAFSALRFLESSERPRRRPRLERWLLLLLRLLLLAALALWLAQPAWLSGRAGGHWIVHWPAGAAAPAPPETAAAPDARHAWLAPGFPPVDAGTAPPSSPQPGSAASLLRQLDAELPAPARLTVLLPAELDGLDAVSLVLGREVDWQIATAAPPLSLPAITPAAVQLELALPVAAHPAERWLRALLAGWHVARPDGQLAVRWRAPGTALPADGTHWWLALDATATTPPAGLQSWLAQGGHALAVPAQAVTTAPGEIAWRAADGTALAWRQRVGKGQWVLLAQPLDPRIWPQLLEAATARHLLALFEAAPAPSRAYAAAVQAASSGLGARIGSVDQPHPLEPWWVCLIAVLFLGERLLAGSAPRRPPPGAGSTP